jgi:fucose permease
MMVGLVLGSVMTGQLMLRIKRYHYLGTLATALLVIGTYLMSQISTDTQQIEIVRNLVIIGFGVGITFPLYLNAVQSAVEPRFIGVVTSQIQFFRNVGATIGTAVLGAFLSQRLPLNIQSKIAALNLPPQALQGLGSGNAQQLFDPSAHIPAPILAAIRDALAATLQDVFLAAAVASILAMVASVFLADVPIRRHQRGAQTAEPTPAPAFGD